MPEGGDGQIYEYSKMCIKKITSTVIIVRLSGYE